MSSATLREPTSRQQGLAKLTRQEHDVLVAAMHYLEAALAAAAPGRELAWANRVHDDLAGVCEALAQHISSAEGPGKLFEEIDTTRPTLMRRVERLRREHSYLLAETQALRDQIDEPTQLDYAAIRRRAQELLNGLRRHQAAEADLVFESFCTDIGAGD